MFYKYLLFESIFNAMSKFLRFNQLIFSLYFVCTTIFFKGLKYIDREVFFGGDEWEYQSIALNFAKGNYFESLFKFYSVIIL